MKFRAFTLFEVLVAFSIFSILMIVTYNLFTGGNKQFVQGKNIVESIGNIRIIFIYLKKDIDKMKTLETKKTGSNQEIKIIQEDGNIINWSWDSSDLTLKREVSGILGGKKTTWAGIKNLYIFHAMRCYDKNGKVLATLPPIGAQTKVTNFNVFKIDLDTITNNNYFSEYHGVKIKIVAAFKGQVKEVYLSRYIFPYTASKRKVIKWKSTL